MITFFKRNFDFTQGIVVLLFLYIGIVYFSYALSNILLGLAVFVFIIAVIYKKIELNFKAYQVYTYLFICVPFLLTLISAVYSDNSLNGMKYVWLRAPILVIPFILVFMEVKTKILVKGLTVFVFLTIMASLVTIYNAIRFINEDVLFSPEFTFFITVIQHPYLGIFVLIAFVSIIEFQMINIKWIKIIVFSILIITISLTTSRLVYLLFIMLIGFYLFKNLSKWKAFILMGLLAVFAIAFVVRNQGLMKKVQSSYQYNNSPRLKLWHNAHKVVTNSNEYLLGIGIGDFYQEKHDVFFLKENKNGKYGYNPHSQMLEFYVTNGVFGVILLLLSVSFGVKSLTKQIYFSTLVFGIILIFSLTESIFARQFGVQLYCVFLPLIFKINFKK